VFSGWHRVDLGRISVGFGFDWYLARRDLAPLIRPLARARRRG
jgi:hypothetical protein